MENTASIWFYTFSTVAQVMAALVGLFAVFVVYKIQDFSSKLDSLRHNILVMLPYVSSNTADFKGFTKGQLLELDDFQLLERFKNLLEHIESHPNLRTVPDSFCSKDSFELFEKLINLKRDILQQLKNSIFNSFGTIAISVVCLVSTDLVISHQYIRNIILTLFLGLFLVSLWAIGTSIYSIAMDSVGKK